MREGAFELIRDGRRRRPRFILCSDLDHTMVQNEDASHRWLLEFGRAWSAELGEDSLLVYSTGRSPELYLELWNEAPLLAPDVLICSVGSEIFYRASDGGYQPDTRWREQLDAQGRWDRGRLQQVAAGFRHLTPQQDSEQRPHKLSYNLDAAAAGDAAAYVGRLEAALRAAALDVRVVYSGGRDVDLLAAGADKGRALAFLLQQIPGDCQPPLGCQVSGDSGNDVALFTVDGVRGCVVANAHPELLEWARRHGEQGRVLLASQPCAGGILEALRHFGTLTGGAGCSGRQRALGALHRLLGLDVPPCEGEPEPAQPAAASPGGLLHEGCTLVGPGAVGGAGAGAVEQLRSAMLAAAGCPAGATAVQWLDQAFARELPGDVWVVGGLACCMDAQRSRRAATAIACSAVLQFAGASGGGLQVVHLHWHCQHLPAHGPAPECY